MAEEEQFTMTVVQTRRRPRPGTEPAAGTGSGSHSHTGSSHHSHTEGGHHSHTGSGHHSRTGSGRHSGADESDYGGHRRHYNDYGTEDLGALDEAQRPEPTAGTEPSRGELQRAFYNKYDAALQRRYSTRNQGKVSRILAVAALLALIVLLLAFAVSSLGHQTEETLPRPEVETIPIVTLDLG